MLLSLLPSLGDTVLPAPLRVAHRSSLTARERTPQGWEVKGSCPAPKELWDFLSAPWLRFLGRKSLAKDELGESDASAWTLGAFVPQ